MVALSVSIMMYMRRLTKRKAYAIMHTLEVLIVLDTNITNFRNNLFGLLEQTVKYNQPIHIRTKDGNAVVISEEDYNGLMETLHFCSVPGMKEKIIDGLNTPLEACIPEDKAGW